MRNSCMMLIGVLAVVLLACVTAIPPPQCSPNSLEEVPQRVRKFCAALSTIYELSNAMEAYLDDKVADRENAEATCAMELQRALDRGLAIPSSLSPSCLALYHMAVVRENPPMVDALPKRQDVDHVFLRFGRRR